MRSIGGRFQLLARLLADIENADGLLVPASAIYTQNEQMGVVRINQDGTQVFIPVDVVATQGDKVFISAIQTGVISKGQTVRLFH